MKTIPLSDSRSCPNRGRYVALVDDEDYEWATAAHWSAFVITNNGSVLVYAAVTKRSNWKWMHRSIVERAFGPILIGSEVDHIEPGEHGGLDNRRSNLRVATRSGNMANVGLRITNKSGFKGVWWDEPRQLWSAKIKVNYKAIHLGRHRTAEDAARAYDLAARQYFGEFARLNFPDRAA